MWDRKKLYFFTGLGRFWRRLNKLKKLFINRGYELLETSYVNSNTKICRFMLECLIFNSGVRCVIVTWKKQSSLGEKYGKAKLCIKSQ